MNTRRLTILSLLLVVIVASSVLAVQPSGGSVNEVSTSSAPADAAGSDGAIAGNVTEVTLTGFSNTQAWQGYFGNVSGTIQLADASDNVLYNWSLASPQGEVYASNESSINWAAITCFDLAGNHSALEDAFGIAFDDVDGVNETFSDSSPHDEFFTNNVQFTADQCPGTQVFDSTGAGVDNNFEEVLLTDGSYPTQVIFTSLIDEDVLGFDQRTHDFEMLVLEDGHGTDTATTTYYFYVELE